MTIRSEERLQQSLDEVTRLLDKHRVLDTLAHRQEGPKRDLLEPAASTESGRVEQARAGHARRGSGVCPRRFPDDRRLVWEQATADQAGLAFVEVAGVVREWLVEATPPDALEQLLISLDPEDSGCRLGIDPARHSHRGLEALASADRQAFEESIQHDKARSAIT
jgi:magnesium transporter